MNRKHDEIARKGLVSGHQYSILKTEEVKVSKGKKVRLIKLRNPWARQEWLGDWSDSSELWTPNLRKQL